MYLTESRRWWDCGRWQHNGMGFRGRTEPEEMQKSEAFPVGKTERRLR